MQNSILPHLHSLISHNVIGDKQYISRYKGFVGELSFQQWLQHNQRSQCTGGYFLPVTVGATALKNPIYFTVSSDPPTDYVSLYHKIQNIGCHSLFFIQWIADDWRDWIPRDVMAVAVALPVPRFTCYRFDSLNSCFVRCEVQDFLGLYPDQPRGHKQPIAANIEREWLEKLAVFDETMLLNLYVQRLFFDGFIGLGKRKGIPTDIDVIIKQGSPTTDYVLIEVKEKDLSKNQCFGMDQQRIQDIVQISQAAKLEYYYVVKHVNNQQDRVFLNWRYINMLDFVQHLSTALVQGGTGMRSESSSNPTQLCHQRFFKTFV